MTITLEQIEAKQSELSELIAKFKAEKPTVYCVPEAVIELRTGDRYAGLVLNEDGTPSHHLVLLPDDADDLTWPAAKTWANEQGGELPTRREQALLYANLKGEFEGTWYWSGEPNGDAYAWFQHFDYGFQGCSSQDDEFRARAVRRLSV